MNPNQTRISPAFSFSPSATNSRPTPNQRHASFHHPVRRVPRSVALFNFRGPLRLLSALKSQISNSPILSGHLHFHLNNPRLPGCHGNLTQIDGTLTAFPSLSTAQLISSSTFLAAGPNLVFDPKTKGAQMLTKKVSIFEKSERLSILTQKRSCAAANRASPSVRDMLKFGEVISAPPAQRGDGTHTNHRNHPRRRHPPDSHIVHARERDVSLLICVIAN